MSDTLDLTARIATLCELLLWLLGIALFWRVCLAPAARLRRALPKPLPRWTISLSDFALAAICVFLTALFVQAATAQFGPLLAPAIAADPDSWLIVQSAGFQFGALLGVVVQAALLRTLSKHLPARRPEDPITPVPASVPASTTAPTPPALPLSVPEPSVASPPETPLTVPTPVAPLPTSRPLRAGLITFVIALPIIVLIGAVWKLLLESIGVDPEPQDMISTFIEASSPVAIAAIVILAAVVAPVTEELIFRAGLFRYLRTRIPRWAAFVLPAVIFGSLHQSTFAFVPLTVFGLILAIAYERTGRIAVPIVAHALFNLHTIVLLVAGLNN